ncbi:MAG: FAD-dependent oxidoreductase, partial [Actinomycetota bacterium]|nr:FAD-dependent oxidoreductase [Actinomycetota bacterium]
MTERVVVVGAGPAGLAAAHELSAHGVASLVVDRNDRAGGLARTIWRGGYGFDLGPHRFFTKNQEVLGLWRELLGGDLLEVDRLTRIYYRGRFFAYPLKPLDALAKLGPVTTARALASYGAERLKKHRDEPENFEEWIVQQFGRVLFEVFFKSYTEKVWGIPCDEIGKEWAGQRIKGLNLTQAIRHAFSNSRSQKVRSLVERFYYPRRGAGQLYDVMVERLAASGTEVRLGTEVTRVVTSGERVTSLECGGESVPVDHAFVSAPITAIAEALDPPAPQTVLDAARSLYYRSHITVNLIVDSPPPFPDNWIYIHSPQLRMARVANYASFSPALVGAPGTCGLSVEYFCFEGDELWAMADADLVGLAVDEMHEAGLLDRSLIRDGFVVREGDSYPTYYLGHREHFETLFAYLSRFQNLSLIGRAGMY